MSWRRGRAIFLGILLASAAGWQTWGAGREITHNVAAASLSDRSRALTLSERARIRNHLGDWDDRYQAVLDHVPPTATIVCMIAGSDDWQPVRSNPSRCLASGLHRDPHSTDSDHDPMRQEPVVARDRRARGLRARHVARMEDRVGILRNSPLERSGLQPVGIGGWQVMVGTIVEIAVTVLVPLLLGLALLRTCRIHSSDDRIAYPAWAWIGGALLLGLLLLAWMSCGLPIRRDLVVPCLVTLAGAWFVASRFVHAPGSRPIVPRRSAAESMVFGVVVALALLYVLDRALLTNLRAALASDEALNWASRAAMIFDSGGFGDRLDQAFAPGSPKAGNFAFHADYPLFNPLLQLWSFITSGVITHTTNRVPIQVFDLALVLATAAAVTPARQAWRCRGARDSLRWPDMAACASSGCRPYGRVRIDRQPRWRVPLVRD